MAVDVPWAVNELRIFVELVEKGLILPAAGDSLDDMVQTGAVREAAIATQAPVAEGILDRVTPEWRTTVPKPAMSQRWARNKEAALRAITVRERQDELREKLGDDAPTLSAGAFHPWAWEGARSMWGSRHYRQAVVNALLKVQAEAQNKTGRFDLSETRLFQQLFSLDAPKPDAPRLREDEGSDTYRSVHRGAAAMAEGLFAGVRNPAAHTMAESEVDEQHALEQLAAVSVLARWVDDSTVATAP